MRSAIYARISADKRGDEAGVTRQLEDCRNLAHTLDWHIVEEYVDNDISASTGKPRPRFQALLKAIDAGEVDAIVTWAPDRLYRKLRDLEPLIEVMEKSGCTLRTVRAGEIDMSTPTGRMLARILASVATAEGEVKSDRWRRSIRQRRENGQAPGWGRRLFGYTRTGEVIDHEADAARWAARELIDGASRRSVAHGLTQRAPTTTGGEWTIPGLKAYFGNARIAGHSTLNGDTVGIGTWEPILDEQTFEQVRSALKVRRGTGPGPRIALLSGLVHCGECGAVMVSARGNKVHGQEQRQRVYRCPNGVHVSIAAEPLEEMVEAAVKAHAADPRLRAKMDELSATTGENTAEIITLEDRLRELEKELDDPGIPIEAVKRSISRTQERIDNLRGQVAAATPLPRVDTWPDDLARRHRAVRAVVAGVIVGPRIPGISTKVWQEDRVRIVPR